MIIFNGVIAKFEAVIFLLIAIKLFNDYFLIFKGVIAKFEAVIFLLIATLLLKY